MPPRKVWSSLALGAALMLAGPANAQDAPPPSPVPPAMTLPAQPSIETAAYERARAEWLGECRRRHGNGNKVGSPGDYCQSYLDRHAAYTPQPMMVPVMMAQPAPAKPRECVEEVVTEEYDEAPARRVIPRPRPAPAKRVRVN